MKYDIIVHGVCFADLVFSNIPRIPRPGEEVYCGLFDLTGGASFITAVALARLGVSVAIIAPIGNDLFSQWLKQELSREGVDTKLLFETVAPLRHISVAMNYQGDRGFLSYVDDYSHDRFIQHSQSAIRDNPSRFVHISGRPGIEGIVSEAHAQGTQVSMDVGWNDEWIIHQGLKNLISAVDLFMPNEKEALAISGTDQADAAIRYLRGLCPNVVVKLGKRGALMMGKADAEPRLVETSPMSGVVDTTGAGDNFDAGVLAGFSQNGDLHKGCVIGNICGGRSVQALGGNKMSPTRDEVNAALEEFGWRL